MKSAINPIFLLEKSGRFIAIEVKSAHTIHSNHFRGLKAIQELAGLQSRLLVYTGNQRQVTEDGIHVLPLPEFLKIIESGDLWKLTSP